MQMVRDKRYLYQTPYAPENIRNLASKSKNKITGRKVSEFKIKHAVLCKDGAQCSLKSIISIPRVFVAGSSFSYINTSKQSVPGVENTVNIKIF